MLIEKGTCTLAIVSMHDIPRAYLQNPPLGPFPETDVAKLGQVYFGTTWPLTQDCLQRDSKFGWATTGKPLLISQFQRGVDEC